MKHNSTIYSDMLADLSSIIEIESLLDTAEVNAPFGKKMRETLDWFIAKAKSYGLDAYETDGYYGVVEYGGDNTNAGDKKMFAFAGHLDMVEAGSGWTVPPFKLTQKNGYLYGRGVVDNKGPAIAVLHVLKALKDNGVNLKHRVRLIVGCNEESGSLCLKKYSEVDEIPAFTLVPDADFPVIYSEKGIMQFSLELEVCSKFKDRISELSFGGVNTNMIPNEARAILDGKEVKVKGVAGHAMAPENADNASWKLFKKLERVCECCAKQVYGVLCCHQNKYLFDYQDEVSGKMTMAMTKGKLENGKLTLTFDTRLPICADKDKIIKTLERALNAKATIHAYKKNLYIDPKSDLVQTLLKIYQTHSGDYDCQPKKIGGGTYARELPNAIAFGAQFDRTQSNIHNADEKVSLKHFNKWFDIYYATVLQLG